MASVLNRFNLLDSGLTPKLQTVGKYFCTLSLTSQSNHVLSTQHTEQIRCKEPRATSPPVFNFQFQGHQDPKQVNVHRFFRSGTVYTTGSATNRINFTERNTPDLEDLGPEEKAEIFKRPKGQTTIDEDEISHFSSLAALWWDEGGEFEALHSLNDLRVPLVRDGLVAGKRLDEYNLSKPLEGCWIMDVGSGGGILSEPLGRLGASVIGLEASEENIKIAQAHLMHDPSIRDNVKYIHATVESISEDQQGKFDAVVASEVLEHVAEPETFVSSCCQLVRPGGSVFFTTVNKTTLSYVLGVVVAERVLGLVAPGTHDWNKFIPPRDLQFMLEQNGFTCRLLHGMLYNPLSKRWTWTKDTSISYAIHAVRPDVLEGVDNVWTEKET